MTIRCKHNDIIIRRYNDAHITYINVYEEGKSTKSFTIKDGIKQRYKWCAGGSFSNYKKQKPITSQEIQDKIIKSIIKTLGGVL